MKRGNRWRQNKRNCNRGKMRRMHPAHGELPSHPSLPPYLSPGETTTTGRHGIALRLRWQILTSRRTLMAI